ncbi:hypothetical protein N7492_008062 [Penicillium capsulatum]|uniref:Glycosyl transferase family 25 domain-containing protein n=1 Tax=Penicillium capsulatum TaxID=69766 RepID=A0A9W9HRU3_9EURO|nr:hypothetical protein N7492_008062 [Penicillium capsulatum]
MTVAYRFPRVILLAACALLFFCYILNSFYGKRAATELSTPSAVKSQLKSKYTPHHAEREIERSLDDITNTTLGFNRVFAIGLKDRMDKRDAMTIGTSLTNIDLEWVEGVRLAEMSDKSHPASWKEREDSLPELAAWRAHMNVLQKIVAEKIPTALVFEDDIDWDVTIKAQLKQFARGARALQKSHRPPLHHSSRVYVIPDDPTVAPSTNRIGHEIVQFQLPGKNMETTRFVLDYADVPCSLAYGITYEAALRTLTKWSLEPNSQPFDNDLRELCDPTNSLSNHGFFLRCIAPYPLLFGHYRKEGPAAAGSDIREMGSTWQEAHSHGIVFSTMLNAKGLLTGATTTAKAQYAGCEPQEIDFKNIELPRGYLYSHNETDNGIRKIRN